MDTPGKGQMTYEHIEYEVEGTAARIRLNRPKAMNALSRALMVEVTDALAQAKVDDNVRVVILSGNGRCFSAGYEIADDEGWWDDMAAADVVWDLEHYTAWERGIWDFPKPTIAQVHGYCLAGACEVAMLCDITVAAEGTQFGEPEVRFATGPPALIMPWVVGMKAAKELLLTGRLIDAARALRLGMVNDVVPQDQLERRTQYYAQTIATVSPLAVRLQKEALNKSYELTGLDTAFYLNAKMAGIMDASPTEENKTFDGIRKESGLRAALNWRDEQFRAAEALLEDPSAGE
jgi:enoyl-CoA hydratase